MVSSDPTTKCVGSRGFQAKARHGAARTQRRSGVFARVS